MGDEGEQAPKIIVDSDWKSQAQAEKEKLAAQEAKAPGKAGAKGGPEELPPADFRGLVGMLATQAVMYMGGLADRSTGQAIFDPEYSKHMIDLLGVLEAKTKGNLSDEESKELGGVLQELRLRFVELAEYVAKGGGRGVGGGPGGAGPGGVPGGGQGIG